MMRDSFDDPFQDDYWDRRIQIFVADSFEISLLFKPDGALTPQAFKACRLMKILPETLHEVTEEDLLCKGVVKNAV